MTTPKLENKPEFTLREIRNIVSKSVDESVVASLTRELQAELGVRGRYMFEDYPLPPIYRFVPRDNSSLGSWQKQTNLPSLSDKPHYYGSVSNYSKKIDRLISKYGPDSVYPIFNDDGTPRHSSKPTEKGGQDERLIKGGGKGPFGNNPTLSEYQRQGNEDPIASGNPSPQGLGTVGGSTLNGRSGSNPATMGNFSDGKGNLTSSGSPLDKGGQYPTSVGSQYPTTCSDPIGDQLGVGSQVDAYCDDDHRPLASQRDSRKTTPILNDSTRRDGSERGESAGMYPHPHKFLNSFESYTKTKITRLPPTRLPLSEQLSKLFGSVKFSEESNLSLDVGDLSTRSQFRDSNPGGQVNAANAKLHSKQLRAQAASIRSHLGGFFQATEVGTGSISTPRINPTKLINELVGKSMRLNRAAKEEFGTGLKLVLVDISPSCAAIRDACYAAAVALADSDPSVVVIAHFNGYMYNDYGDDESITLGTRQKEVPIIEYETLKEDLERFKSFLGEGRVSGVIAFGDNDAAELYSIISEFIPLVWMTPLDKAQSICALEVYCTDIKRLEKAGLFIVPEIKNATDAVNGLRAATKAISV